MLRTEQNTRNMERSILRAFRAWSGFKYHRMPIGAWFEHGQWWVILTDDCGDLIYSVVDAEGGRSVDGFDFEGV